MIDQSKRKTLRNVASIGIGGAALGVTGQSLAAIGQLANHRKSIASAQGELAEIEILTRLSSTTNELEIVLTNTGSEASTITDMTPAQINTVRGKFDFNSLFKDGALKLNAGQSVVVPMHHHPVVLDGSSVGKRNLDLQSALHQNVSVITDGDSLAAVVIKNQTQFS